MTPEELNEKAEIIINKRKEENALFLKCLDANICPKCGHKIKEIEKGIPSGFLWFKKWVHGPHCDGCGWERLRCYPIIDMI